MMSRFMMLTCTALWGLTFTSFLVFLGVRVVQVSSSMEICEMQINTRVLAVPFIVLAIFDTVSTIAISIGLTKFAPVTTWTERVESVVALRSMGRISRNLLRSGWIYYVWVRLQNILCHLEPNMCWLQGNHRYTSRNVHNRVYPPQPVCSDWPIRLFKFHLSHHHVMPCVPTLQKQCYQPYFWGIVSHRRMTLTLDIHLGEGGEEDMQTLSSF